MLGRWGRRKGGAGKVGREKELCGGGGGGGFGTVMQV